MANRILVQDGKITYATSDPVRNIDMGIAGLLNVTKQVNVGDDPLAAGMIQTPPGSSVDLKIKTNTDGVSYGNIKLEPVTGGRIILNNVAWPSGIVSPIPGMYLGVSGLNTLQFYTLPTPAPKYQLLIASAAQTVFNTSVTTIANGAGSAYLQVFVQGVKQIEGASKNYQVTGANQITFNAGLILNNNVEFYAFV
jgi:hypothetical protein